MAVTPVVHAEYSRALRDESSWERQRLLDDNSTPIVGQSSMTAYPTGPEDRRIDVSALEALVVAIFLKTGTHERDARDLSESLVLSDVRHVHSHGTMLVAEDVARLTTGGVEPHGRPRVVRDEGTCLADADNSMGHVAMRVAMDQATVWASVIGIGACAVRSSNRAGAMASYAMQALRHAMIGLATTKALPTMPPFGGTSRLLGIHPLTVALPAVRLRPIVRDAPFSHVAHGEVRVFARRGARLPEGSATDRFGVPPSGVGDAIEALFLPTGGFKGVALAMVMGVLSSLLSGAAPWTELGSLATGPRPDADGHFEMATRVGAFEDVAKFRSRVDEIVDGLLCAPRAPSGDGNYLPGELEFESVDANRALGVLLDRENRIDPARVAPPLGVAFDPQFLAY
jgi:LDH2 family malate/lactate/ureidoglycolate dehydrogenase